MSDLTVSLIQAQLDWESPSSNKARFESLFDQIDQTDLIVLPETFTTGFSMNSIHLAEEMNGETIQWMAEQANKRNAVLTGSLIIKEEQSYYNRLILMRPNGQYDYYDKRHLFKMAAEDAHFSNGNTKLVTELKGWKVCPLICYDLRFPVWSRNVEHFDLLIYVANWPEPRIAAWEKLNYARAIENQCYVAAVNRIGEDGKQIPYSGNSMLIDPKGELLWKANNHQEEVQTLTLSRKELNDFRKKFPVLKDADQFQLL